MSSGRRPVLEEDPVTGVEISGSEDSQVVQGPTERQGDEDQQQSRDRTEVEKEEMASLRQLALDAFVFAPPYNAGHRQLSQHSDTTDQDVDDFMGRDFALGRPDTANDDLPTEVGVGIQMNDFPTGNQENATPQLHLDTPVESTDGRSS